VRIEQDYLVDYKYTNIGNIGISKLYLYHFNTLPVLYSEVLFLI